MQATTPKPFCFVLMPFDASFDDVYKLGIKEACNAAGAYSERVDEQTYDGRILDRIYNQIAKADFIVADMTGRNPNVFYEVGYAHALGKRTVLVVKTVNEIPFDLRHFPHVVYGGSISVLRDKLNQKISWFINNPAVALADTGAVVRCFIANQEVTEVERVICLDQYQMLEIIIQNVAGRTLDGAVWRMALIFPADLNFYNPDVGFSINKLPDGRTQVLYNEFDKMLPEEVRTTSFRFAGVRGISADGAAINLRIYGVHGPTDFPLRVRLLGQSAVV